MRMLDGVKWPNVGLRELLGFSFILHKIKLLSATPIILVSPIWEVFVKAEV